MDLTRIRVPLERGLGWLSHGPHEDQGPLGARSRVVVTWTSRGSGSPWSEVSGGCHMDLTRIRVPLERGLRWWSHGPHEAQGPLGARSQVVVTWTSRGSGSPWSEVSGGGHMDLTRLRVPLERGLRWLSHGPDEDQGPLGARSRWLSHGPHEDQGPLGARSQVVVTWT